MSALSDSEDDAGASDSSTSDRQAAKANFTRSRSSRRSRYSSLPRRSHRNESPPSDDPFGFSFFITVNAAHYHAKTGRKETWISDGGTNCHVTNDEADFIEGTIKVVDIPVSVGNGVTQCNRMGDVLTFDQSTGHYVYLPDTLLLRHSERKLYAEGKADVLNGCSIIKPGGGSGLCQVIRISDSRVVAQAKMDAHRLYAFAWKVVKRCPSKAAALRLLRDQEDRLLEKSTHVKCLPEVMPLSYNVDTSSVSFADWLLTMHRMYGHYHFAGLRKMLGLRASTDNPLCNECEVATARKRKMDSHTSRPPAQRPLERMHMDGQCFSW